MTVNGRIPASQLTKLSTPGSLLDDAALAFEWVIAEADLVGTTAAVQAYRTYQEQEALFVSRYQTKPCEYAPGKVDRRVWNGRAYYRKPGKSAASVPGTSNHGFGLAVDFQSLGGFNGAGYKRLAAIAADHGLSNATGIYLGEPWHWEYTAANDKYRGQKYTASTVITTTVEDTVEQKIFSKSSNQTIGSDWTTVRVSDEGATSVVYVSKATVWQVVVSLALTNLKEGRTVQVRWYEVECESGGKNGKVVKSGRIAEMNGTSGSTFLNSTFAYKTGQPAKGKYRAVRLEIKTDSGVVIDNLNVVSFEWE